MRRRTTPLHQRGGYVGITKEAIKYGTPKLINLWRGKYTLPGKSPQRRAASNHWGWRK